MSPISRRHALAILGAASGMLATKAFSADSETRFGPVCAFGKHLQWLSFDELADFLAENDFDGLEATIRRGGQVEPENVERDLPKLVKALAKRDRKVYLATSDVNADSPLSRRVLKALAEHRIPFYRMSYYRYDLKQPIMKQIDEFRSSAEKLAKLNEEFGITGVYQNHAGAKNLGGTIWDIRELLKDISPDHIGVAFDIRHVTVEAGQSWPVVWSLIKDHIRFIYAKDFIWDGTRTTNVPLGTGQVSDALWQTVRNEVPEGTPISMHMEYHDHRDRDLLKTCMDAYVTDRKMLKKRWGV